MQKSLFAFGFASSATQAKKRSDQDSATPSPDAKKPKSAGETQSKYFTQSLPSPIKAAESKVLSSPSSQAPGTGFEDEDDFNFTAEELEQLDKVLTQQATPHSQHAVATPPKPIISKPSPQPPVASPPKSVGSAPKPPAAPSRGPLSARPAATSPMVRSTPPIKTSPVVAKKPVALCGQAPPPVNKYAFLEDIRDAQGHRPGEPGYDPSTLHIPLMYMTKFTAFEKQYWEIKKLYFDTVVFFRKGKFFELFETDAEIGVTELGLRLSNRVSMKMAGMPASSFDQYAGKLLAKGYKVTRVDQVETLLGAQHRKLTKGQRAKEDDVIRREVTRVLSVGTVTEPGLLSDHRSAPLLVLSEYQDATGAACYAVCILDAAAAEFRVGAFTDEPHRSHLRTLLLQVAPREVIHQHGNLSSLTMAVLRNKSGATSIHALGSFWSVDETVQYIGGLMEGSLPDLISELNTNSTANDILIRTVGGCLAYLQKLKIDSELLTIGSFVPYDMKGESNRLILDGQTLLNLEVLENAAGGTQGTLIGLLDHCVSSVGKRMLRKWLCHPLRRVEDIDARLDAVDFLKENSHHRDEVFALLKRIPDIERFITRIRAGSITLDKFVAVLDAFAELSNLFQASWLSECPVALLKEMAYGGRFPDLSAAMEALAFDHQNALDNGRIEPPSGTDADYDVAHQEHLAVLDELESYVQAQRKRLSEPRVQLTYASGGTARPKPQLEVPIKSRAGDCIPHEYTQIFNTTTIRRYSTPQLRDIEVKLAYAAEQLENAAQNVLRHYCSIFATNAHLFASAVQCAAELDSLCSLSVASALADGTMCRPKLTTSPRAFVRLRGLRHPCITLQNTAFIPNDVSLGTEECPANMLLLTGPNMGGKSTLLRQTCIAVILAQLGCYVPAESCELSPADRIFTRLGAADDIMAGHSTFMVELNETANILRYATSESLVILDELGRGTSTFDGYAIAYAVLQHLVSEIRCRVLFSTHYHMLTEEFHENPHVLLGHMACRIDDAKGEVLFLYKLKNGVCPKSYGMNVAAMAGIPPEVIRRAEEMAAKFESESLLAEVSRVRTASRSIAAVLAAARPHSTPAALLALKEKLVRVQTELSSF